MIASEPLSVRHREALADIPRDAWNRLFPRRAEDWDYFRACEQAAPSGFSTAAIGAYAGDALVAAVPLFKLFGPMMAFDRMDPDLQALGADAPYLETSVAP